MRAVIIPNATQQITVWTTAYTLEELMETVLWSALKDSITDYNSVDAIDIYTEWDIRYSHSATPTTSAWMVLKADSTRLFRWIHPSKLKLIAWSNTLVNVCLWDHLVN